MYYTAYDGHQKIMTNNCNSLKISKEIRNLLRRLYSPSNKLSRWALQNSPEHGQSTYLNSGDESPMSINSASVYLART